MLKMYQKDLMDLSKDKVPNVRIKLAEAFYNLYKQYEKIDLELGNRKLSEDKRQKLSLIKERLQEYLNQHFYRVLRNLKYD